MKYEVYPPSPPLVSHVCQIIVMWSNVSPNTWNILPEILVRVVLLLCLLVLHMRFEPDYHYITKAELAPDYKRTRRESRVAFQTVLAIIILLPLLTILSQMLLRNYGRTLQGLLGWTLALVMNALATEVLKVAVGRPRPDFFYRCFPDGRVTDDYHCTGAKNMVADGRKSFPSGHSSFSFCSLGFLALWLRWKVLAHKYCSRVAFWAHVILVVMATVISVTRIWDNRHHWEDVVAGAAMGVSIAYLSYTRYSNPPGQVAGGQPLLSSPHNQLLLGLRFGNACSCRVED